MSHMGHGAGGVATSVREEVYKGHKITIRTAYRVEIDGKLVKAPLVVDDAGRVHCHSLPNYQTPSAVGMVEALIDNFPNYFAKKAGAQAKPAAPRPRRRKKSLKSANLNSRSLLWLSFAKTFSPTTAFAVNMSAA